jgi:hypothetical protein
MREFEEALEGCNIRDLKGIGLNDQKVWADKITIWKARQLKGSNLVAIIKYKTKIHIKQRNEAVIFLIPNE